MEERVPIRLSRVALRPRPDDSHENGGDEEGGGVKRSRSRSRSRSSSGSRKEITTDLSSIERSLTQDFVIRWWSSEDWNPSPLTSSAPPAGLDLNGNNAEELRERLLRVHHAWRECLVSDRGVEEKTIRMVEVLNEYGAIRELTGDEEIWFGLYLMFSDYVTVSLSRINTSINPASVCDSNDLKYCGLCQSRAENQDPEHVIIRRSHLQPRFIQNFVFLRPLPTNTSQMDEDLASCFHKVSSDIAESTVDIACLPLLCQCTESTGQGCEDLFSRWESRARDLLFSPIIENLKNPEPVTFPVSHHVYKFAVSLVYRGILTLSRNVGWNVTMQGFRAARWILRRHGSYRDVFPVYVSVPNVCAERTERVYLEEKDPNVRGGFIRELLDSSRCTLSGDCVIVSCGPVHFMVDCSFNADHEKELVDSGVAALELLTFFFTLDGNGARPVPLCVQNAAMYRAKTEPFHGRNPHAEVTLARCILANSDRPLTRIMAQHKIDVEAWSAT